jgi:transposase
MPRFKPYDYRQDLMVPISLEEQLIEGTLEHALHHLIEERTEEKWFEDLYGNEETGRPAYSPKLLLKVILLGYARGLVGSRRLERACRENITFMALACGIRPDHSTLAGFVEKLRGRIDMIFAQVLLVCHEEGLLSGTHLSLDGLKLPSNASREWSGSFKELRFKEGKLRRKLQEKLAEHPPKAGRTGWIASGPIVAKKGQSDAGRSAGEVAPEGGADWAFSAREPAQGRDARQRSAK